MNMRVRLLRNVSRDVASRSNMESIAAGRNMGEGVTVMS